MRKKTFIGAIIISLILIPTIGSLVLNVAEANPLPPSWMNPKMTITIHSPRNGTDNTLPVFVNFTAQSSWHFSLSVNQSQGWIKAFFYVLDGQNMSSSGIRFAETQMTGTSPTDSEHYFSGQAYLTNLTDGSHSITVYYGVIINNAFIVYDASWSATSQFYVITETPSPTPNPTQSITPSPSSPEFPSWTLLMIILVAVMVVVVIYKRRLRPQTN